MWNRQLPHGWQRLFHDQTGRTTYNVLSRNYHQRLGRLIGQITIRNAGPSQYDADPIICGVRRACWEWRERPHAFTVRVRVRVKVRVVRIKVRVRVRVIGKVRVQIKV